MAAPSVDWREHVREAARVAAKGMESKWGPTAERKYNELFRAYLTLQGCRGFEDDEAYKDEESFYRLLHGVTQSKNAILLRHFLDHLVELFAWNDEAWFHSHYSTLDEETMRQILSRCGQMIGYHDDYNRKEEPGWSSSHWIFMRRVQQEQRRARMLRADLATGLPYQHNVPHELVQLIGSFASAAVSPQRPLLPRMQAPSVREYADRGKSARKAEAEVEDEPPAKR